ncbi:MAG: HNH endonuclease [Myxococcales bacterium]|nr:HNH endonuclease [Myxococcales bacterium]
MARNRGSKAGGGSWTDAELRAVWSKGAVIIGKSSTEYRQDVCGATMWFSAHGDISDPHGWEVDHMTPVAAGGGDEIKNLQPLHWKNNRAKGDGPLKCDVKS